MLKNKKWIFLVVLVAALLIVLPTQAKGNDPTGERLSLILPPANFPAGEPFHVVHGWYLAPSDENPIGLWSFELYVDDVLLKPDFNTTAVVWYEPTILLVGPLFNFPEGMDAGVHTFTGHWYAPCSVVVDYGWYPGPCSTPNAKIETDTTSVTVEFTE